MEKPKRKYERIEEFISGYRMEDEHVGMEFTDAHDIASMFVEDVLLIAENNPNYNLLVASYTNSILLSNILHDKKRKPEELEVKTN